MKTSTTNSIPDTAVLSSATANTDPTIITSDENQMTCPSIKDIGTGTARVGMLSLFLLAISASVTLDVIILMAALSGNNSNRRNNDPHPFLTGYLLGSARGSRSNQEFINLNALQDFGDLALYQQSLVMLLATAPSIGITAGVAAYYKHPDICNGFLSAWGAASGLLILGVIIHSIGHKCQNQQTPVTNPHGFFSERDIESGPIDTTAQILSTTHLPVAIQIQAHFPQPNNLS